MFSSHFVVVVVSFYILFTVNLAIFYCSLFACSHRLRCSFWTYISHNHSLSILLIRPSFMCVSRNSGWAWICRFKSDHLEMRLMHATATNSEKNQIRSMFNGFDLDYIIQFTFTCFAVMSHLLDRRMSFQNNQKDKSNITNAAVIRQIKKYRLNTLGQLISIEWWFCCERIHRELNECWCQHMLDIQMENCGSERACERERNWN